MPTWLLEEDKYEIVKGKERFVDKSIEAILSVLSKFSKRKAIDKDNIKSKGKVLIISLFLFIVLVSLSKNSSFTITSGVIILLTLSAQKAHVINKVLKISFTVFIFSLLIFLPAFSVLNKIILLKILICTAAVSLLNLTLSLDDILSSLKDFFIPDIFIMVLDITIKYIMILGDFAVNMLYALKLRSVGRSKGRLTSLSGIIGTMFIKSKEMAEETYGAMECRGFTGEYKKTRKESLKLMDFIFIIGDILLIFAFIYFSRV